MAGVDREEDFSFDDIKIHSAEVVDKPLAVSPYAKPVEIIVEANAWSHMNRHAAEDMRHEAGGVMLGGIYEHEGSLVVRITAAVAARDAITNVASIQFTYAAWSQMEQERQRHAPDEKLLGWYHTHPGFSAFFSDTDRFLHEHFFTQPWHVALVIDPIHGEYRFYRWDNGRVREVKEFLLKVEEWPGPHPPLNAVLSTAFKRAARHAEPSDAEASAQLAPFIEKLMPSVSRSRSEQPLNTILSLIVACADLPPEVIAEARKRSAVQRPVDSPVRYADLEVCAHIRRPDEAVSIADRWFVQQSDRLVAYVHGLDDIHPFYMKIPLPMAVHDLTVAEHGRILLLARGQNNLLYRVEPVLDRVRNRRRGSESVVMSVSELEVNWRDRQPPSKIGKILSAGRDFYLLTKNELWVLAGSMANGVPRYECVSVHGSTSCGWESFTELADWTGDSIGNLYLLSANRKEIWRFDRLADRWSRFLADEGLKDAQNIAAGATMLTVYQLGATPALVQYSIADAQLAGRRTLEPEVGQLKIWQLFSDGNHILYLVTENHVYQLR